MTCTACDHEHAGIDLAGICVGCPCEHTTTYVGEGVHALAVCIVCGDDWPCATVRGDQ